MSEGSGDAWKARRLSDGPADDPAAFVRRWSRRKQAGSRIPEPAAGDAPPIATAGSGESVAAAPPPALETLSESSDVSAFLGPKVEEKLRRLALRKLFHMPKFNIRDGLDDYDDDYRAIGVVASTLGTAIHERVAGSARRTLGSGDATPAAQDGEQGTEAQPPATSNPDPADEPEEGPASS
ncbi:MAG TPA: DUF3306 domain-containing protein [Gammaproteobacteria bacterium]|nr:DUF3306 domain-containing protein [Gammaproteobacteria bacterium]